ncbi:MAG: hypothetical protein OEZ18_04075 [Candidatus Bathyarchaeota archaeon]|nr:hypothetical protein [Candidatus Bathyarchaeota archaeon]
MCVWGLKFNPTNQLRKADADSQLLSSASAYDNPSSQKKDWKWIEPYQEGVFDCSEMSAYLERKLENEGWHMKIIVGDSPFGSGRHAWLLVETSVDKYMPVESTDMAVVLWDSAYFDNYFKYDHAFEKIQDALKYSETEFDWWN